MSDNLPVESVPPTLSGPDAPKFPPVSPGVLVDLALIESLDLRDATERAASAEQASAVIADAEARAAKLIAAAVADAEEQVADVQPLAEAEAAKIIQEAKDEAATLLADAEQVAAKLQSDAETLLATRREEAAEIIANAESEAQSRLKELDVDRQLVRERTAELEAQQLAAEQMSQEAAKTLSDAKAEAERMTIEAGETVDRLMRSGQAVAEAQREAFASEAEDVTALQAQHAAALRELTDRYETKVSNQNIENLELRQEIANLRQSVADLQVEHVAVEAAPAEEPADPEEPIADDVAHPDDDEDVTAIDDFASQWMIPEDSPPDDRAVVTFDDPPAAAKPEPGSKLGKSTGLEPNTRLVEPLKASAFRPSDEGAKKRRRRKR